MYRRLAGISGVESRNQIRAHRKIFSIDPVWDTYVRWPSSRSSFAAKSDDGNQIYMFNPDMYWFDEAEVAFGNRIFFLNGVGLKQITNTE